MAKIRLPLYNWKQDEIGTNTSRNVSLIMITRLIMQDEFVSNSNLDIYELIF